MRKAALESAVAKQDEEAAGQLDSLVQALHEQVKQTGVEISEKLDARIERLEGHVDARLERMAAGKGGGRRQSTSASSLDEQMG